MDDNFSEDPGFDEEELKRTGAGVRRCGAAAVKGSVGIVRALEQYAQQSAIYDEARYLLRKEEIRTSQTTRLNQPSSQT